ncbi:hypothetical protein GCM10010885_14510 [Alicyclobacillus cellulosilyticus]|uniref:Spore protein YkvP/CgeB glycosyl transferase-like domain-containing protein n=1 Tax=Alicyclobacillus cellulosilyticus TaxID=1003997 RepID=A0A917KC79_9BACL|nr:glycosyltransferase [Alicyclobacillus cellulosilyticus]GGJ06465.1 hypothetical protein GCM10010885_14510 [Alicyclobacillus cellulosilyticus]
MKVLHAPTEIAGQMGILTQGLRRRGVTATAYNTFHSYLGYRDHIYNLDAAELAVLAADAIRHFDLFHFHYGQSLTSDLTDVAEIARLGKPMLMHHWGNDVRTHEVAARNNPYVYTGDSPPPERIHARLTQLSRFIQHAVVQDEEVRAYVTPYYREVHVLPIAFDVHRVAPSYPAADETCPLVVHAPTNPAFKGTHVIEAAVEQLRAQGVRFRYLRVEKRSNREALALYREADIVVDQVLCGSYGLLAVEAMSLGKPVLGFIREDLRATFPEPPPIVSARPDQVADALRELIEHPALRIEKGRAGRRYAERHHASDKVARRLLAIYEQVVQDREGGRA